MEVKLQNLIEKIQKEGVENARKQAEELLRQAREEADALINEARDRAGEIEKQASNEAEKLKANADAAIRQAARDSLLSLKKEITGLFEQAVKSSVSEALDADFLKEMILRILDQWAKGREIHIELSKKDRAGLEKTLGSALKGKLKEGVTLKIGPDVRAGFRLGVKGEDVYYDFTDESIAEVMKVFLNPRIQAILDAGNG